MSDIYISLHIPNAPLLQSMPKEFQKYMNSTPMLFPQPSAIPKHFESLLRQPLHKGLMSGEVGLIAVSQCYLVSAINPEVGMYCQAIVMFMGSAGFHIYNSLLKKQEKKD